MLDDLSVQMDLRLNKSFLFLRVTKKKCPLTDSNYSARKGVFPSCSFISQLYNMHLCHVNVILHRR